eukprot:GABW01001246.1.p1 GENE.GABW01001246.1~~GABW01001246.1.p1  ORF type:complete len:96 (+),score=11.20 GABW01001246.1:81-368(+)
MLPDGAHLRDEDWTTFFLNRSALMMQYEQQSAEQMRSGDELKPNFPVIVYQFRNNSLGWELLGNSTMLLVINEESIDVYNGSEINPVNRLMQILS